VWTLQIQSWIGRRAESLFIEPPSLDPQLPLCEKPYRAQDFLLVRRLDLGLQRLLGVAFLYGDGPLGDDGAGEG